MTEPDTIHENRAMTEEEMMEDFREDWDEGPEWDFTDEDGEEHNVGEYV